LYLLRFTIINYNILDLSNTLAYFFRRSIMNSTIIASLIVLLSSIGLGMFTGYLSFALGSESLKGVKSPEENPSKKILEQKSDVKQQEEFQFVDEKKILVKVYDHIHQYREANKKKEKSNQKK
jgi:hypothetical protein